MRGFKYLCLARDSWSLPWCELECTCGFLWDGYTENANVTWRIATPNERKLFVNKVMSDVPVGFFREDTREVPLDISTATEIDSKPRFADHYRAVSQQALLDAEDAEFEEVQSD